MSCYVRLSMKLHEHHQKADNEYFYKCFHHKKSFSTSRGIYRWLAGPELAVLNLFMHGEAFMRLLSMDQT